MILAIDPSFTSTGVSLHKNDGELVDYLGIHEGGKVYKSNKDLHKSCSRILNQLFTFIDVHDVSEGLTVVIEIPAPSQSGFYLAMLHGWLVGRLSKHQFVNRLVTVSCLAVNSYTKNKARTKSYLVEFAKAHQFIPAKRINNDIATAAILAHVYIAYLKGTYKNTVNILDLKK